jgi:hypothetical protein
MLNLKEYVVSLKSAEDLESFYEDMETPGGDLYIPNRAVEVSNRRPLSRNTQYLLTDDEAELIKKDPRVLTVRLTPSQLGIEVKPLYTQTAPWDKSSTNNSLHKNWGLFRCYNKSQVSNWGSNGTASITDTINVNADGRHVDVVIVDGMINPAHPEFAVNEDGTGGSRVIQYNWFQHNNEVWPDNPSNNYVYTPYTGTFAEDDNNHGAHVAGTVTGNTQGWARRANIYNLNPYSTDPNGLDALYLFDYIRAFHRNKPINPATGRKNPTIVNNSWGYFFTIPPGSITNLVYRGNSIPGPYTTAILNQYGVWTQPTFFGTRAIVGARFYALEVDIADAVDEGIIVLGAAGNNYSKIDVPGGVDFDNRFSVNGNTYWFNEGASPGAASLPDGTPTTICVGSIGTTVQEFKSDFSNCGPRVEIYAPGSSIMSSVNSTGVNDPRNSQFRIIKYSGTSMASPQVTGILACALQTYPSMNNDRARQYLDKITKSMQIGDTGGGPNDYQSLQGSPNKYLCYTEERVSQGLTVPKRDFFVRPTQGLVYPRTKIRR